MTLTFANGVVFEEQYATCAKIAKSVSNKYGIVYGIEGSDVESHLNEYITRTLESYDSSKCPIEKYVKVSLERRAIDYVRCNKRHINPNYTVTFSALESAGDSDNEPITFEDDRVPHEDYIKRTEMQRIIAYLFEIADETQKNILNAFLEDGEVNANRIAEKLGMYPKKIYRKIENLAKKCDDEVRISAMELLTN